MEYFLNSQVFLCRSCLYVVILDLRRDRYSCLPEEQFDLLAPWLNGWDEDRECRRHNRPDHPEPAAAEVARALLMQGILTLDTTQAKPVRPVRVPPPVARVAPGLRPLRVAVLRKAAAFFLACHRADRALRNTPFEAVIARVNSLQPTQSPRHLVTPGSEARAARLTTIFETLRPVYPRPYLCTFDSLALIEFLAREGLYPRWIFAVRADPFHAHCWVQYGETLLNDRIERVTRLTPIMAV